MSVLVDTCVWSLALRRRPETLSAAEKRALARLQELALSGTARLIGPIRQEILTGIKEYAQFEKLRDRLRGFEDEALLEEDFEVAAEMSNSCLRRGVAAPDVDLLICSVAFRRDWSIWSNDKDFVSYE